MLRPLLIVLSLLWIAAPASATTISLSCLTSDNACPAGESEIQLDVTDNGQGQVSVVVSNLTSAWNVESVYIGDSSLIAGVASVTSTPDVDFQVGSSGTARPTTLPGGGAFAWPILIDSTGTGPNAIAYVSAGESVEIILDIAVGTSNGGMYSMVTPADVIAAIEAGDLRIGVLLNDDGLISVPEPAIAAMLALGALGVARRRRA